MLIKNILEKQKDNQKIAIKQGSRFIRYKELYEKSQSISVLVQNFKAQNISIYLPNSIEYAMAYFSITLSNKVIIPIPIQAKKAEIVSTVQYCETSLIISSTEYITELQEQLKEANLRVAILDINELSISYSNGSTHLFEGVKEPVDPSENDVAIMLHTSGTTSDPKRVMLSHKNLIENIKSNVQSLSLTEHDVCLIGLPMFFGYCNTAQFLTHLYLGATLIIQDKMFTPHKFFQLVQNEKVTNFTGVPSMLLMILDFKNKNRYDISSLRFICFGGGHISKEKLKELMDTFSKVSFIQTYGQTEASPRIACLLPNDSIRKLGSVGKPIPNVKVRIVDENGQDVPTGAVGELIAKGPNVMLGYYKKPEITKETIKDGWLYTGDLAKYDDEGFIYLLGRRKNIIISGGINIYPEEIEEMIINFPSIKEVCVIGEEHEILGQVPIAKIVLKEGTDDFDKDQVKDFCFDRLSSYKIPSRFDVVDTLPKTKTGKIKRKFN